MGLRETINQKKSVSISGAIFLLMCAGTYLVYTQLPTRPPKINKLYYTVDDGKTWFADSIYKTPPYDYNGQAAVRAMVYSYDHGDKTFCPFLQRYNSRTKKQLDDAVAQATRDGKPLSSVTLFSSPAIGQGVEIKLPGPGHKWFAGNDPVESPKIYSAAQAPDGSDIDTAFPK
jgi:hypothetical protein